MSDEGKRNHINIRQEARDSASIIQVGYQHIVNQYGSDAPRIRDYLIVQHGDSDLDGVALPPLTMCARSRFGEAQHCAVEGVTLRVSPRVL